MPEAIVYDSEPDVSELPIHPLAEGWAIVTEAELQDLADEITANRLNRLLVVYQANCSMDKST